MLYRLFTALLFVLFCVGLSAQNAARITGNLQSKQYGNLSAGLQRQTTTQSLVGAATLALATRLEIVRRSKSS